MTELGAFMRTDFYVFLYQDLHLDPWWLASCKSALNPQVVYSTDRSKAIVPVLVLLFVALWFILGGDFFYVLRVILFLCFSVILALRLPRLGKRELILVLFVRLFDLHLFGFVGFLFLLVSGKGCGLWLWHSLDFSLNLFGRKVLGNCFDFWSLPSFLLLRILSLFNKVLYRQESMTPKPTHTHTQTPTLTSTGYAPKPICHLTWGVGGIYMLTIANKNNNAMKNAAKLLLFDILRKFMSFYWLWLT